MAKIAQCAALLAFVLAGASSHALASSALGIRVALVNCLTEGIDPSERIHACNEVIHSNILVPHVRAYVVAARGNAYFAQGEFEAALDDYNTSVTQNDKLPQPVINRAITLTKMGKCDQAAGDLSAALASDAQSWRALYGRSLCEAQAGDQSKARADLAAAVAINPDAAQQFGPQEIPRWF